MNRSVQSDRTVDRTFLFISFGSFKIINSRFYNVLMYYSNVGKYF